MKFCILEEAKRLEDQRRGVPPRGNRTVPFRPSKQGVQGKRPTSTKQSKRPNRAVLSRKLADAPSMSE